MTLNFTSRSQQLLARASVAGESRAPMAKNYVSNGYVMNNRGYLANPSHSAQIAANNAGALTRSEATSMGLPLSGRR